jgi:hypothetical protein
MSSRREADTAPGVTVLVLTGVSARRRRAGSFMAALAALGFTALLLSSGINVVDVIASAWKHRSSSVVPSGGDV